MMKVGITGGIGSGKSTVCRLFAQRGVAVYDSDAAAKRLMTEEPALRAGIAVRFGAEAYAGGALNRPYLAAKVFSDPAALAALTDREYALAQLAAQRLSNREIAEKLFLSEGSVKQYVKTIYDKLHIEGDTRTKRKRLAGLAAQKV